MVERAKSDVRQEILAAATRLFARHGYDGTSLQAIADQVGLRKPSLLYHFDSKETLRQAVLDEVLARWNDTLPKLVLAATAGQGQFDAVTQEIVSFFAEDPDRGRLLIREALDRPDDLRQRINTHVVPVVTSLASNVRRGKSRGDVWADVDPEAYLFQAIILLICGVTFSESFGPLMPKRSELGAPRPRLYGELLRIARVGLFSTPRHTEVPA